MTAVQTRTITTKIPARLDRLPWARWHWMVVIGLGTGRAGPPGTLPRQAADAPAAQTQPPPPAPAE